MRTIPIGLAAKYQQGTSRLSQSILLERPDGLVIGLTSASTDFLLAGQRYLCDPGVTPTNVAQTNGLAVANLEATFLPEDIYITPHDVLAGLWANTRWTLFECDPLEPDAGIDIQMFGQLGDIKILRDGIKAELRSITQLLQQTIGQYTSKTCRVRLFSQGTGFCNVSQAAHTYTGALTAVSNRSVIADSSRAEPSDWFGAGLIVMTSGPCLGMRVQIREFAAGVFTLSTPLLTLPEVGDTYTAYTGCRKRAYEDCRDKFSNILNFQGEPHLPGVDYLTSPGDVTNG